LIVPAVRQVDIDGLDPEPTTPAAKQFCETLLAETAPPVPLRPGRFWILFETIDEAPRQKVLTLIFSEEPPDVDQ
jgi:hypothetical protein